MNLITHGTSPSRVIPADSHPQCFKCHFQPAFLTSKFSVFCQSVFMEIKVSKKFRVMPQWLSLTKEDLSMTATGPIVATETAVKIKCFRGS